MYIRQEQPSDYNGIYELVQAAFQTAPVSEGDEQDYVNKLRETDRYIPELALVCIEKEQFVGHIMLTKAFIQTNEGSRPSLLLSPLCVRLEYRSQGYGAELIREASRRAIIMGYQSMLLVGDPNYYQRFGFRLSSFYDITNTNKDLREYTMARELHPNALEQVSGTVTIV